VKKNIVFQRDLFRATRQNSDETVGQYIQRLRTASDGCEFGIELDNNIRDQLVSGIRSDKIRRKMLASTELTLSKAETMATQVETLDLQYSQMTVGGRILKVSQKPKYLSELNREHRHSLGAVHVVGVTMESLCVELSARAATSVER
jgi:hypothetical protein